jgi:hypothetical protein
MTTQHESFVRNTISSHRSSTVDYERYIVNEEDFPFEIEGIQDSKDIANKKARKALRFL